MNKHKFSNNPLFSEYCKILIKTLILHIDAMQDLYNGSYSIIYTHSAADQQYGDKMGP